MFDFKKISIIMLLSVFHIQSVWAGENIAEHSNEGAKQESNYYKPADQDCRDTLTVLLDGLIAGKKDFSIEYVRDGLRGSSNLTSFGCRNYSRSLEDFAFSPEFEHYQQEYKRKESGSVLFSSAKTCKQTLISNAKHSLGLANDQPIDSRLISDQGRLKLEVVDRSNQAIKIKHFECTENSLNSWNVSAHLR